MAITRRTMQGLTPTQVFDVLRDGKSYEHWVVGTRSIRAVDPGWPAEGARLHYTVGYAPLRHDNVTLSRDYAPDRHLELEVVAWPAGTAHVRITTAEVAGGAEVSIDEKPIKGLARTLHNPALDALIKLRNVETLRRLEQQARRR